MAAPNARDTKLIQYLNEAYGKERELETALAADIAMTTRQNYRKRLREHLKETRDHARRVKTRVRELGGRAEAGPISAGPTPGRGRRVGADVRREQGRRRRPGTAAHDAGHRRVGEDAEEREDGVPERVRGDRHLHGDRDPGRHRQRHGAGKVAREIRREEERMAKFLEKQIPQLAKAVAKEEIPAAERRNGASSARRSSSSHSCRL